jgi:hypothetical protein
MTDEQVADIYAIARESFAGGQREIQLQSYPFHMTAENMAKFRLDPNIDFWKDLKNGSDHFEVTKAEPPVLVCGKRYVFNATAKGEVSATQPCPALTRDPGVEALVAEKEQTDDAKVADLVASGVKPIRLVYADGGQNSVFAGYKDESDPDALATGPQEIVLADSKPAPAAVKIAVADAAKRHAPSVAPAPVETAAAEPTSPAAPIQPAVALASAPIQASSQASGGVLGGLSGGAQNVKKWLHLGGQESPPPPVDASAPDQPAPADAPLPPRRDETSSQTDRPERLASLHTPPTPPARPNLAGPASDDSNSSKSGSAPAAAPAQ